MTDIDGLKLSDIQLSVFQKCASSRPSQQAEQRKPPKVSSLCKSDTSFVRIVRIFENFREFCVSYLNGCETDQQQGLNNGDSPFCNCPRFLRLPRTQGCHQHL